jgi:hypothetical protein
MRFPQRRSFCLAVVCLVVPSFVSLRAVGESP